MKNKYGIMRKQIGDYTFCLYSTNFLIFYNNQISYGLKKNLESPAGVINKKLIALTRLSKFFLKS